MSVLLVQESTPSTMNYYLSFVLLVSAVSQIDAAVNVTLFYETLCPYCVDFIRDQMYPTYRALGDHLYMDLVPFGKASWTTNPWSITCQHGPRECHGNAIQACALERYKKPEMQMKFITCLMSARIPEKAGAQCAKQLGYDYTGIEECAVGQEGRNLHIKHGTRTKSFNPPVKHVPFIVFNNKYNAQDEQLAYSQFKRVVCSKFPPGQRPPGCDRVALDAEDESASASEEGNVSSSEEEIVRPLEVETVENLEEKLHNSALW